MCQEDGPGPFLAPKFWFVDTNLTENKEVVDPTNPQKKVYIHGGQP
jgi:hypothetical protein